MPMGHVILVAITEVIILVPWIVVQIIIYREIDVQLISPWTRWPPFADDIFKCIFMTESFCVLIQISLKFVPKGPIDSKSALVHVMTWRRTGNKPLPEPMLAQFTDAYVWH